MKKLTVTLLIVLFLLPVHVFAKNETVSAKNAPVMAAKSTSAPVKNLSAPAAKTVSTSVEEQFKKSFPKNNFESITSTEVKGIYEVYTGNQIYYYMPKDDVILYGSLVNKGGVNMTRESFLKKMAQKMAKLPLDSALKIGNGKKVVVEFTDPNCPFCRESHKFFTQYKDLTIYAFLFPLSKESADKVKHILCSKDAAKAFDDALSGRLDNTKLTACSDKKVDETAKIHMQLASQVGLRGTPLIYIQGQVVDGFEKPVLEKLLKD